MAQVPPSIPNSSNLNDPSSLPLNPSTSVNPARQINGHDLQLDSNSNNNNNSNNNIAEKDSEFFKEMRGWLMIVAILAAGSTYQAGLSPPGGFWQDSKDPSHTAGNPILHDEYFKRYLAFFYCNAISFLSSLVIIILLMNRDFFHDPTKIKVLKVTMVLDLFSFMAAYAAGCSRRLSSSFYVFLLMGAVFVCIFIMFIMATPLRNFAKYLQSLSGRMVGRLHSFHRHRMGRIRSLDDKETA